MKPPLNHNFPIVFHVFSHGFPQVQGPSQFEHRQSCPLRTLVEAVYGEPCIAKLVYNSDFYGNYGTYNHLVGG